ncbi:ATP-binding protein [Aliivibrio sifiae]|uniref:ATP-binding protein n=1 Tax=Aliivibrio sifiae TaxID=566293 RepID=UPI003D0F4FA9
MLKVLIGNLIKNAFNCTEERQISLLMNQNGFSIIDSGIGLDSKPRGIEGFGLGLLIVRDICQLYDLSFTLNIKKKITAALRLFYITKTMKLVKNEASCTKIAHSTIFFHFMLYKK